MICAVKDKKDEQQTNKDTEMRGLKMHQRTAVLHQKTIQYSSVFVQRRFFLQVLHASWMCKYFDMHIDSYHEFVWCYVCSIVCTVSILHPSQRFTHVGTSD